MIFSIREYGRGAIREWMYTFNLKVWREKERDEDVFKIAIRNDRGSKNRKVKAKPSIYT